jgi:hypothetical protein
LSHQRGKKPNQTKTNKKNKAQQKYPKFKCSTISVSLSTRGCSSVISSKEEKKKEGKKKGLETVLWMSI